MAPLEELNFNPRGDWEGLGGLGIKSRVCLLRLERGRRVSHSGEALRSWWEGEDGAGKMPAPRRPCPSSVQSQIVGAA